MMNVSKITSSVPAIQSNNDSTTVKVHEQRKQIEKNELTLTSKEKVKSTVDKMNDFIDPVITNLKFVFHEDLHEYYVIVVNPITEEVIREIPPKKMLDMYAAMTEYMGLLVDEKI